MIHGDKWWWKYVVDDNWELWLVSNHHGIESVFGVMIGLSSGNDL